MQLKKFSPVVLAAGLLGLSGAAIAASITVDPSAPNTGGPGVQICLTCSGALGGASPYVVNSIQTSLGSMLDINAATGTTGWQESGQLVFSTYNLATQLGGARFFGGGRYDIYGTFLGSGGGTWAPANQFNVTSISSFVIQLWASPESGSKIGVSTPTTGTQANGGVTAGSADFLLGTATFAGSFGGTNAQLGNTATCLGNPSNCASEQLTATFNFNAASPNYTGPSGYFQAPIPFVVAFNGSGSSNYGQSTYVTDASGVHIRTAFNSGATGNLTPLAVPEPGALSLAGIALLGLALASRRKGKAGTIA